MKTTASDINKPNCVNRPYESGSTYSEPNGKTFFHIYCPFCRDRVKTYVWSLAGGGKRCDCGAYFSRYSAYKLEKK